VVVLIGLSILAQAIKSDYNNSFSLPRYGFHHGAATAGQGLAGVARFSFALIGARAARQAPAAVPWPSQV
jgi:hypothetical protein